MNRICLVAYLVTDVNDCLTMKHLLFLAICVSLTAAYPMLKNNPVLSGPDINKTDNSFVFRCEVIYPFQHPNQAFEIVWTFQGEEDNRLVHQVLTGAQRIATLSGTAFEGHLDRNLGCSVQSFYKTDPNNKSPVMGSNTYFAGIQMSPSRLNVEVGEMVMTTKLTVVSTLPILCDHSGPNTNCCLMFRNRVDQIPEVSITLPSTSTMCSGDWNPHLKRASMEIPLQVEKLVPFDGEKHLNLIIEELDPPEDDHHLAIFRGYKFDPIQINIKAKKGPSKDIISPPKLNGPTIYNKESFELRCEIFYIFKNTQRQFEVVWTFDGQRDPEIKPQILYEPEKVSVLNGLKLQNHWNSQVECQVKPLNSTHPDEKDYLKSNSFFVGLRVDPSKVEITGMDFETNITLISTIPVLCNTDKDCCVDYELSLPYERSSGVIFKHPETTSLCYDDWNEDLYQANTTFLLKVKRGKCGDGKGLTDLSLFFEEQYEQGRGPYFELFFEHRSSSLPIMIKRETFTCSMYTDPHMITFDGSRYVILLTGDFVAADVPSRDFQLQMRLNGGVVCGLVIREGNDVIKIDKCFGKTTIEIAYPLSRGTAIQRSTSGSAIGVYLPSGTELKVKVAYSHLNVYLTLPSIDKSMAHGLCGTNDGVPGNDWSKPDGHVEKKAMAFFEAWRVSSEKSLFKVVDHLTTESCEGARTNNSLGLACPRCPDITQVFEPTYSKERGWYGYEHSSRTPDPKPINVNQTWPNAQNVTEREAHKMCIEAVEKAQLYSRCRDIADYFVVDCMTDILYTGNTDFLDGISSAFTGECQLELAKDPKNIYNNSDGQGGLRPEILDICPVLCHQHGHCNERRICVCDEGWEGSACQIDNKRGPQLVKIVGGSMCDKTKHSCKRIQLEATNVHLSVKLMCRFRFLNDQGKYIDIREDVKAKATTPDFVFCPLPKKESPYYLVSLSNGGSLYGNELRLQLVYEGNGGNSGPRLKPNPIVVFGFSLAFIVFIVVKKLC